MVATRATRATRATGAIGSEKNSNASMGRATRLHVLTFPSRGKVRQVLLSKTLSPDITIGLESLQTGHIEIIEGGTIGLNRIMSAVSGAGGAAAGALWGPGCVQGVSWGGLHCTVAFY